MDGGRAGDDSMGVVFNVQRSSFHDGPGIRTTVFLKGCLLSCPWCHNPESIAALPEVSVNQTRCVSCGACDEFCPRPGGPLRAGAAIGADGCSACGTCFEACPAAARQPVGRRRSVTEMVAEVLRDRLTYDTSGGGATFSGGEPLQQPRFLVACLEALRREAVHVAVDTCGLAARETVVRVAETSDLLLWDVKHLDPIRHQAVTGAPLEPILANLRAAAATGVPIWLRMPVIPGVTDDPQNLADVARLAAVTPGVERVNLLPYHRTGTGKRERLQRPDSATYAPPSPERLAELACVIAESGVVTTIGG